MKASIKASVYPWPGALPVAQDGVFIISSHTGATRAMARRQIRLAVCQVMAAIWGVGEQQIRLASVAGQAPRLWRDGVASAAGVSISHDEKLSLAAINLYGAVGIDHLREQIFPDWQQVARDYLGPLVTDQLSQTMSDAQRALAFARAWSAREASLKCLGLGLSEWQALSTACHCIELALPEGLSGMLALTGPALVPGSRPVIF